MRNYLSLFMLFTALTSFAQNHAADIAKHREQYKADFLADARSPLKAADLQHLHFYEADSSYRVNANLSLLTGEKIFKMPTYDGSSSAYIRYAHLDFVLNGQNLRLTLYKNIALAMNPAYKDLLFLPFTDQTNAKTSYGGGRYIDLKTSAIVNGKVEIDFNKAYNPYCAYSDGYRCPVPPEENNLAIGITAGEKMYSGQKKHQ